VYNPPIDAKVPVDKNLLFPLPSDFLQKAISKVLCPGDWTLGAPVKGKDLCTDNTPFPSGPWGHLDEIMSVRLEGVKSGPKVPL